MRTLLWHVKNSPEGMKMSLIFSTETWLVGRLSLCLFSPLSSAPRCTIKHKCLCVFLFVVCTQDVYSKRIIPTASITGVVNVGDQKFEVVTHNRTFLFRAESDGEFVFSGDGNVCLCYKVK